jgi:hypothetical protein
MPELSSSPEILQPQPQPEVPGKPGKVESLGIGEFFSSGEAAGLVGKAKEQFDIRVDQAKKKYDERDVEIENKFLDRFQAVMDQMPNNKVAATMLLGFGELIGIGIYGVTDALTLISGIRDIAEGRSLEPKAMEDAKLRGRLRILAAVIPGFPTFWVLKVTEKTMPIPEIDDRNKKEKEK